MKLGIAGTGTIVNELFTFIDRISGIECLAICGTPRSQDTIIELCNNYQIPLGFTDYSQMLATDIDAVYVAVPNHLHYQFCLDALNAGKHVIVEKPITSNYNEAYALAELAKTKNLFLFEAINTLYLKNYAFLRELLPQIGKLKLVQCNFSQYSRRYDAFCAGELLPVFDPAKSGGALMDINIYNLHYVMGLFGTPDQIHYYANIERDIDTSGVLTLKYPDFQAVCLAAKDCAAPSNYIIQGTKGYIFQETPANLCGQITLHQNDGIVQTFDQNEKDHRMAAEFIVFSKEINSGNRSFCYQMLDYSLSVYQMLTQARLSAGIHFPVDDMEQSNN